MNPHDNPSKTHRRSSRRRALSRASLISLFAGGLAVFLTAPAACAPSEEKPPPRESPPVPAAPDVSVPAPGPAVVDPKPPEGAVQEKKLPLLVDLGAKSCIPCKKMAPILEDLAKNHAATFETVFIDVWKNPDAGKKYGIRSIPTQIFFDAGGKELFRHEGFISREDILSKWKELGVEVPAPGA